MLRADGSRRGPRDDHRHAEPADRLAKLHRGDDFAAGQIEQHDAVQIAAADVLAHEGEEGVGRRFADLALRGDHLRAARAAAAGTQSDDAEIHLFGARGAGGGERQTRAMVLISLIRFASPSRRVCDEQASANS